MLGIIESRSLDKHLRLHAAVCSVCRQFPLFLSPTANESVSIMGRKIVLHLNSVLTEEYDSAWATQSYGK